jgi:zinc transporter ZupT
MIDFALSFLAWVGLTLIPALLGLLVITWAGGQVPSKYVVAFAFGILFWFFVDTISGSAVLDVNSGFGGGLPQVGVVSLFLAGTLLFVWLDRKRNIFSPEDAIGKYGMTIPFIVAIAVGIHGLGEGAAYGATAYSTTSSSLLDAFGGVTAGVAYVLHKALEPMMIGACYVLYYGQQISKWSGKLRDITILSLAFVIPSLLGAVTGYFFVYDTTYAFAFGTGTSIYVIFRLAGPLFVNKDPTISMQPLKITLSWILGIMAIYFAALFHS